MKPTDERLNELIENLEGNLGFGMQQVDNQFALDNISALKELLSLREQKKRNEWLTNREYMFIIKDGINWAFVLPDFKDLQEPTIVWTDDGDTDMDAVYEQLKELEEKK